MIATEDVIRDRDIGVGDDAFLTGLFSNHYGRDRNIPIVRVGSIAAMPGEKVEVDFFGTAVLIDAYLLEARSIGGLSGSPVFVVTSGFRGGGVIHAGPQFYLLGLMRGHWDVRLSAADAVITDEQRREAVNMGIAVVVPASKILDLTNQPRFVEQRQAAEASPTNEIVSAADPGIPSNRNEE